MVGEADDLDCRRYLEARPRVNRPPAIRRDLVAVRARLIGWRDALDRSVAVEPRHVQVALGAVRGRRPEVQASAGGVDRVDARDVAVELRQRPLAAPFARHRVSVPPAVLFRHPDELAAAFQPHDLVHLFDPGFRLIAEHPPHVAGRGVGQEHVVRVLQPVHVLEHERPVVHPVHSRDVEVTRRARRLHPRRGPSGRGSDADANRGILRARLRVRNMGDRRVERIGVVDEREPLHAGLVELPEGNRASVRAPAEPVADAELLLVDPVGRAVDDVPSAIRRHRNDTPGGEVLDVHVLRAHVGDARAVGGELREHQRRLGGVSAELLQRAGRPIERPVIAARVLTPDFAGVGEDEELRPVGRPRVAVDRKGTRRACRARATSTPRAPRRRRSGCRTRRGRAPGPV